MASIKKQNSPEYISRSNWLYQVIHELGSILSINQKGLYKMEGFYRQKCGARELLAKGKKGLFLGLDTFFFCGGKGTGKGFFMQIVSSSSGGGRGPTWNITSQVLTRKTPDQLIKIVFLVKVETASRSGIKSWFSIMSFSPSDTILGL